MPVPDTVKARGTYSVIVSGFWAPGDKHVWLVGFAGSSAHALLLKSSDAGATWTDLSNVLSNVRGSNTKMHTGFALDANHIWVGGEHGTLFYSDKGGE